MKLYVLLIALSISLFAIDDYSGSDYSNNELKNYNLSDLTSLNASLLIIKRRYLEADKINPEEMFTKALDFIERNIPNIMFEYKSPKEVKIILEDKTEIFKFTSNKTIWNISLNLRRIFLFIEKNIKDKKLQKDIELSAIDGILSTLDPHTNLLRPSLYTEMKLNNEGSFGGLGIVISMRDNRLTVVSPIDDTPASRAGIRSKDKIVKINGESTIGMDINQAVNRMRGKPGTDVVVHISRKGWTKPKKFKITRAIIKIKSVASKLLKNNIAYLKIKSFQGNTSNDLKEHLKKLDQKSKSSLKGIVLDLRNDPGGLLSEAQYVADMFLKKGYIVSTVGVGNNGMIRQDVKANDSKTEPKLPIIVLINSGSASASEIVSGALKTNNRALLLGETTFGKGSVQIIQNLGKEAIKVTIAQYLINYDKSIQGVGIEPDIIVTPVKLSKEEINYYDTRFSYHESDYDGVLNNTNKKITTKTKFNIRYFLKEKKEDKDELYYRNDLQFKDDFEIELARKLLINTKSTDSEKLFKEIKPKLENIKKEQENIISKKLKEFNVNWEDGKLVNKADLTVKFESKKVKSGDKLEVKVYVTNNSDKTLYKVRASSDSSIYFLRSVEFLFGKIEAGKTVFWKSLIPIPKEALTQKVDLVLDFYNGDKNLNIKEKSFVDIIGNDKPKYELTCRIKDENNNKIIEKNEKIKLILNLKNIGGNGGETNLALKNKTDRFISIEKGTLTDDKFLANKSIKANFEFIMKGDVSKDHILLDLLVYDSDLKTFKKFDFKLPVKSKFKDKIHFKDVDIKFEKFENYTSNDSMTFSGSIEGKIKDYYIFNASAKKLKFDYDKVFFKSVKKEKNKNNFTIKIPLRKGLNTISLVARKSKDFFTTKTISVYREAK